MVGFEYNFLYYYPWEVLAEAYLRRYPTSPHIPCLLESTILSESENEAGTEKTWVRRMKLSPEAPWWVCKLTGIWYMFFIQSVTVNWEQRKITVTSSNDFLKDRVEASETATYYAHDVNPKWTVFKCEGHITLRNLWRTEMICERLAKRQYLRNGRLGRQVDCIYINEVLDEQPEKWAEFQRWENYDQKRPDLNQPLNAPLPEGQTVDPLSPCDLFSETPPESPLDPTAGAGVGVSEEAVSPITTDENPTAMPAGDGESSPQPTGEEQHEDKKGEGANEPPTEVQNTSATAVCDEGAGEQPVSEETNPMPNSPEDNQGDTDQTVETSQC